MFQGFRMIISAAFVDPGFSHKPSGSRRLNHKADGIARLQPAAGKVGNLVRHTYEIYVEPLRALHHLAATSIKRRHFCEGGLQQHLLCLISAWISANIHAPAPLA